MGSHSLSVSYYMLDKKIDWRGGLNYAIWLIIQHNSYEWRLPNPEDRRRRSNEVVA
jgi:hypothetical protein